MRNTWTKETQGLTEEVWKASNEKEVEEKETYFRSLTPADWQRGDVLKQGFLTLF